jgi:DHA1 family multidrug resistance protein-like MFS transporter
MARTAPGPDPPASTADTPDEERPRGADAAAGAKPAAIPWQRNLAAIWLVQILAIVGFSLRVPFLPFYLADLGVETVDSQALWSGLINSGGAGVMALTAPFWGMIADRRGRR